MIGRELVCVFKIDEKDPNNGEIVKKLAKIINIPLKGRKNVFSIKVLCLSSKSRPYTILPFTSIHTILDSSP